VINSSSESSSEETLDVGGQMSGMARRASSHKISGACECQIMAQELNLTERVAGSVGEMQSKAQFRRVALEPERDKRGVGREVRGRCDGRDAVVWRNENDKDAPRALLCVDCV
jgi:hypothetical protein